MLIREEGGMRTPNLVHALFVCITFAIALAPRAATAAEGFRLRAPVAGALGAEMGVPLEAAGFYTHITLSYTDIRGVADDAGRPITTAARDVPLPTAGPTSGAIPNGTHRLVVPAGAIDISQAQTQLNLVGLYVPRGEFAGGKFVFRANLPVVRISRDFAIVPGASTISPQPSSPPLPAAALGAVNAVAAAANAQVQSSFAATAAMQNGETTGIGDLELAGAWYTDAGRMRLIAGAGLHLPTGTYSANRGPNPGLGDFRTFQVGVAAVGLLADGLRLGARVAWGTNSTNRKTGYRTGDFAIVEAALRKDWMRYGLGLNILSLRQIEDDRAAGVPVNGRLRVWSAGPFFTWRLSREMSLTAQHSRTFGERSAQLARTTYLRLDYAFR
jgi:hypothetical protein